MPPSDTKTRNIKISVEAKGDAEIKRLADSLGGLNKKVASASDTLGFFKRAFVGAIAGITVNKVVELSDSMQLLASRISVLSGDSQGAGNLLHQIGDAANETKTSVEGLATIYTRLAASTKELKLSSGSLLELTKFLQNTFRLSGATTEEATNGTVQFTQALALGVLRGQDFKSVLSQNVVIGDILSKTLGKTRGELFKMAEAGQLTNTVVLGALAKNFDKVNEDAKNLGQTFGQTLTLAMNRLQIAIFDLNKQFDLSGKFATVVNVTLDNMATIIAILAATQIPALIKGIEGITTAVLALNTISKANLIALAIGAAVIAVGLLIDNFDKLKEVFRPIGVEIDKFNLRLQQFRNSALPGQNEKGHEVFKANIQAQNKELQNQIDLLDKLQDYKKIEREDNLKSQRLLERLTFDRRKEAIDQLSKGGPKPEVDKRALLIAELNKQFESGKVSIANYYERLETLDKTLAKTKFKEGKLDLEQLDNTMEKLSKSDLNRALAQGKITFEEFNQVVRNNQFKVLKSDLDAGKISLLEFDDGLVKISEKFGSNSVLRSGAEAYIKSIGTVSSQIASVITQTFSRLEDSLVNFTKTGKANFSDFAQAVLDDLNRIIIRSLIVQPLAQGLLNYAGTGTGTSASSSLGSSSTGSGYNLGGSYKFAKGGIFDSPTSFRFGGNKSGLMGEAGPEAVVPLSRTGSGELGIKASTAPVFVNITNNSGGQVEQKESKGPGGERILDILIHGKVKEGIANGLYDRSFQSAYGVNRKGN